ncbi:MAG: protein-glutamate O-methyltransferase CheR [Desulfohalobium sp.]
MAQLSSQEFTTLSKYIYSIAGIYLDASKGYLIESRLNPLLVAFNLANFSELYYQAKTDASGELEKHIIDAISTNETFFFRDTTPFELLKFKILPELIDAKQKQANGKIPLSIWSAACSTGQEVYSIAISLMEFLPNAERYEIRILGTDISQQAITQASYGQYNQLEVGRGLSPEYLQKYFQPTAGGWRVKDSLRSLANFKVMNLMHPFGPIGPFDIIFCRNVAIYFSVPDKKKLFARMARVLRPRGYLVVGGSESLSGLAPQFESRHYLRGMYYQLKASGPAQQEEQPAAAPPPPTASPQPQPAPQPAKPRQAPQPAQSRQRQTEAKKPAPQAPAEPDPPQPSPEPPAPAPKPAPTKAPNIGFAAARQQSQGQKNSLLQSLGTKPDKSGNTSGVSALKTPNSSGSSLLQGLKNKKKSRS